MDDSGCVRYNHKAFWSKLTTAISCGFPLLNADCNRSASAVEVFLTHMKQRKVSPFIYSLATLIIMLALVLVGRSFVPDRVQITILGTTDLHGNINPLDYYTNKPDNRGIAKVATLIKRIRKEHPNVLLIDSGDTIQGSPLESFHGRKNNQPPDPMMIIMSSLNYDAMTVGNHEYNFGLKVLEKARKEANFPWLSANTYDKATNQPHYKPY